VRGVVLDRDRLVLADDLELRPVAEGEVRMRVLASGIVTAMSTS
jgi:hypothetical protein